MAPPRPTVPNRVLVLVAVALALAALGYLAVRDGAAGDATSDEDAVSASRATMAAPPADDPPPERIPTH